MKHRALLVAVALLLPGGAAMAQSGPWGPGADDAAFAQMLKTSFKGRGVATLDRLNQDETQVFCSDPETVYAPESAARREEIEKVNLASVKWPADGVWLGDWKEGEKIAQSGRGNTWTDKPEQVNGGNCYNCHQISAEEISHGTIGPSLHNYGKLRGTDDAVMKATWAKIYNSKSNNACSNMPRAGHMGILSEEQMKHLMALLLDPRSPVNQ
ncbi:sulfur oxidation c-type cytochrome SoxX [Azospirillum halopraeferens]|uniref:sulfur oxidation c-type cytochrome SoxX n=1 Tax=Azospirillum halopraeferens TaxID=34010 RepID=UPI0003F6E61F|nr:sulfur oxidation c-type cytochrome SoxX [Azospirillum halopraeferens]